MIWFNMLNYHGKLVLAPMVRSGELPTRILALRHGADLVWGPEVVDKKILTCTRHENHHLNTVEFLEPNGKVAFNTYKPLEAGKLVFQMGSADPDLAVKAGLKVINDVDAIDLNCGCPKNFSVHSGMGAALLSNSSLLCDILTNLVNKVGNPNQKPISCKIRLLKDLGSTMDLIHKICGTGIKNLTIHCRTRDMRNRQDPIHDYLPEIIKLFNSEYNHINLIINGNLMHRLDLIALKLKYDHYEPLGGMIAESAEGNPSVFNLNAPLPWPQLILEFLQICYKFNNHPSNSKYVLLNQIPSKSKFYQMFSKLKTNKDMLDLAVAINKPDYLQTHSDLQDQIKFMDKIKFRYLQRDRLVSVEEYQNQKLQVISKLNEEQKQKFGVEEETNAKLIDFNRDFVEVNKQLDCSFLSSTNSFHRDVKRKLSVTESSKKFIKT